jgi:transcriptional regulator with XRE-family HTH domain
VTEDRVVFCRSLREARLRRGVTLEAIGESSKIQASLLAALERGDLSRWPKGIFRRAFFREYAAAIGLPPETVVSELGRLFPEEGGPAREAPGSDDPTGHATADALRLTLAPDEPFWIAPTARRVLAASLDLMIVLLAGGAVARVVGSFPLATCLVGLVYYGAGTVRAGATPASVWLNHIGRLRGWRASPHDAEPAAVDPPRLVFRRRDHPRQPIVQSADAGSSSDTLRAASN